MSVGKGLASRLRDTVTLQEQNLIDNGIGGRKRAPGEDAWRNVIADLPAEIIPLRGGEALVNLVQRSRQMWRVTIRARPGVDAAKRLTWNDPIMGTITANIRAAALNEDRDGIVMTVESGGA